MEIGVSSACLYPLVTEQSLEELGKNGIKKVELFFNAQSEIEPDFINELIKIKDYYGMNIVSVHSLQSFAESFYLFSNYYRRFTDSLPFYEKIYEASQKLGAGIFVYHGAKIPGSLSDEEYFERFAYMTALGKNYGLQICQENVVHHRAEAPQYLIKMKNYIGDDFGMVLDIKQAYRAGYDYTDFCGKLSPFIKHIHISDRTNNCDCVPPLQGNFDFKKFFDDMKYNGYNGEYIIEVYNWSYKDIKEIITSKNELEKLF